MYTPVMDFPAVITILLTSIVASPMVPLCTSECQYEFKEKEWRWRNKERAVPPTFSSPQDRSVVSRVVERK